MFDLTPAAVTALSAALASAGPKMVPLVTWETNVAHSSGRWIVGFVDKDRANRTAGVSLIEVRGITFAIDGPHHYLHLLEHTKLDYSDSRFIFEREG
jgi:hypothetical protein